MIPLSLVYLKRLESMATTLLRLSGIALILLPGMVFAQSDIDNLGFDGFASAADDVMVSAYEAGRLESLLVKVGDRVTAGQIVATLDDQAQILGEESAATLAGMRGGVNAAEADKTLHEQRYKQLSDLASRGAARPEEVARAEVEYQMAVARWLSAREDLAHREIEWRRSVDQLRRRRVVSPISGVVAKTFVEPGEFVLPSDLTVIQVINQTSLIPQFNVPATDAMRIRVGQRVKVEFISLESTTFGVVETISPMIDGESGTIPVRVRIDNADGKWLAGDRCLMELIDSRQVFGRTTPTVSHRVGDAISEATKVPVRPLRETSATVASPVRVTDSLKAAQVYPISLGEKSSQTGTGHQTPQ